MRTRPVAATLLALATLAGACSEEPAPKANVVLIVVDTLRADHADLSSFQALADDGVRFERAFAQAPMTLPAHAALFTSRQPFESGVKINGQLVSEALPLLQVWLHGQGYQTLAAVSLASLWPIAGTRGVDRGFDQFTFDGVRDCASADQMNLALGSLLDARDPSKPLFLFAHYSDPHEPYNAHATVQRSAQILLDGAPLETLVLSELGFRNGPVELSPGEHRLELVSKDPFRVRILEPRTPTGPLPLRWIEGGTQKDLVRAEVGITNPGAQPVACDLWLWAHDSLSIEEARQRYRLEAEFADREIGAFLADLKRRGLYDASWIVLTADHGEALGEHGHVGHVDNLYDELLHVPLVIKPPKGHPLRAELEAARTRLVRQIDVAPTLLDLLDLPALPQQTGSSLREPAPRVLLAETYAPAAPRDLMCMRDLRFKLVFEPATERFEMYDLASDPRELNDVFAARGGELAEWQASLRATAKRSKELGTPQPVLDPENLRRLQGLGYVDGR